MRVVFENFIVLLKFYLVFRKVRILYKPSSYVIYNIFRSIILYLLLIKKVGEYRLFLYFFVYKGIKTTQDNLHIPP